MIPQCALCSTSDTGEWHKTEKGVICLQCFKFNGVYIKKEVKQESDSDSFDEQEVRRIRRNVRKVNRNRLKNLATLRNAANAPKRRRKRRISTTESSDFPNPINRKVNCLYSEGNYFHIGDIISVQNASGNTFYAQITGLLIDTYCEKFAVITWLIPTTSSPPPNEGFDPHTYLIGPAEDEPRKLSCMEFVMSPPNAYYYNNIMPYLQPDNNIGGLTTKYNANTNVICSSNLKSESFDVGDDN